jgi:L-alanine-DL-glutamate epimerase-like enolase superfamily enzyme
MKVTGARLTRRPAGRCSIELQTDAGESGVAVLDAAAGAHARRIAGDLLAGTDPRAVTGLWERMTRALPARPGRMLRRAIAALDIALWDLRSRSLGEPLWKTLGGGRPRANAHARCPDSGAADRALAAWFDLVARRYGLRGGTLRAASNTQATLRRLELVHSVLAAATAEPVLVLDAGGRWPAGEAIRRIRALEKVIDLAGIEGAVRGGEARALRRVSRGIGAAVCAGAGLATAAEFREHFERRSVDIVQLDLGATGITGALVIADAAFGLELPVMLMAAPGNIHAHLAGVMPGFMSMEIVDPSPATAGFATGVRIEGGWGVAGDAPGHGLVLS